MRLLNLATCPNRPFAVQWRSDGRRKTKNFLTETAQIDFAKAIVADAKNMGVAAYRLDPAEAMAWRAFRAQLGEAVTLDVVLACWHRHGKVRPAFTVRQAANDYLAAKEAEGVSPAALAAYGTVFNRLCAKLGNHDVGAVSCDEVAGWVAGLGMADYSRQTHAKRLRGLFSWLKRSRVISENPCDGLKPVRIVSDEVAVLTVEQTRSLFANNEGEPPELLGRLALEAFAGLRFESARQVTAGDVLFAERGIALPAAKIKTRRRQFIDGLPDNLWHWLEWSRPAEWIMTPRQYLEAKSKAFVRARVPHPRNCLRHSFATYHVAANRDVARTAVILCHSSPKMLWQHYKGRGTEADGAAFFLIYPTGAACPYSPKSAT